VIRPYRLFRRHKNSTAETASTSGSPRRPAFTFLRGIAAFKLVKSLFLCCLGIGAFKLLNPIFDQRLTHWVGSLAWSYNRGIILSLLNKITGLGPLQLRTIGAGAFVYAILFAIEGIGLWLGKRWAEYLTLVATCSLLPLEIYELLRKATYSRGMALILNLVIAIYLADHVRRRTA
jgi:uncharacterized membrane protein (DUF2068 family)